MLKELYELVKVCLVNMAGEEFLDSLSNLYLHTAVVVGGKFSNHQQFREALLL